MPPTVEELPKIPFEWAALKVVELKQECRKRDLAISGRKADLVKRLENEDPYKEKA